MSIEATPFASTINRRFVRGGFIRRATCVLVLVALADFLLSWNECDGLALVLFALAVTICAIVAAPAAPRLSRVAILLPVSGLALLPGVVDLGALAFGFMLVGSAYVAASLTAPKAFSWAQLLAAMDMLSEAGWRMFPDVWMTAAAAMPYLRRRWASASLLVWVVPLALTTLFLSLLADANPIIAAGLQNFDPLWPLEQISPGEPIFWLFIAAVTWPFIAPPDGRGLWPAKDTGLAVPPTRRLAAMLLGRPSLLRALILFNALFAAQTVLDISYLWLGKALPAGLTYADYAHRGAYPLIVTALLAGAFAIAAMRPGSEAAASKTLRWLVLIWIIQNIGLVISSVRRLYLYIQAYSLTELRFAAFIWMVLVGIGLLLIVASIVKRKSDLWLIRANILALGIVLYGCTLLDVPSLIANYDVRNCIEVTGQGASLDVDYLHRLGPAAIPALDFLISHVPHDRRYEIFGDEPSNNVIVVRDELAHQSALSAHDWRRWTARRWLLARYLQAHPH